MKKMILSLLILAVSIIGCGGSSNGGGTSNNAAITGVELSRATLTLSVGADGQLTAYVLPRSNANNITWTSSNTAVATVDANGKVTAVASGTATITATATGNTTKYSACTLTVTTASVAILPTSITLSPDTLTLSGLGDTGTLSPTISPSNATDSTVTWISSNSAIATVSAAGLVTAVANGTVYIIATTVNGKQASVTVTVSGVVAVIKASDAPTGYAGVGAAANFGGYGRGEVTVSTRDALLSAVQSGNQVIYVSGMIDMSNGMLPTTGGGSTTALDSFVSANTTYTTYAAFKTAYAAGCTSSTEDASATNYTSSLGQTLWKLNTAYKQVIQLQLTDNTTIIGIDGNSGIKGATISISSKSNIALRNLIIRDAYDPFPHHESGDGFNSQHDGICVQETSSNIWIDHCTFEDTMGVVSVAISGGNEKWQTYDGLCDIKNDCQNITVSNCKFMEHDKTMLIGSSDSDGSNSTRTITLSGNYFYNCGQRLPMVRNSKIHIYNNYYDASNPTYAQSYAVGVRKNALIVAENNYFGSGIKCSFKDSAGTLYISDNIDNSADGVGSSTSSIITNSKPFDPAYTYTLSTAAEAKTAAETSAGSGKLSVVR